MRTSTFKRNWMLHYIQPEYLYLPRASEQPEPHPEGTTRVYFRSNNYNLIAQDGSGIILAVYNSKGKIIFCSHYKNGQEIYLYSDVYTSTAQRYYYYKIISTPYISTSYKTDSYNFLILPPGKYYYRYIRDTMTYAEIERYKLYNFTVTETDPTSIKNLYIDISEFSLEYLEITTEVEQKDYLYEENAVLETGTYNGYDITFYRAGIQPTKLIPTSAYLYLKYNIILNTSPKTIVKTINRDKIPRANYSDDAMIGWGTGERNDNCEYYLYYINSIRESVGKIQDYWIGSSLIGNSPIQDYRGGLLYNDVFVYIGALRVIRNEINYQIIGNISSNIVYNAQQSCFTINYSYPLPGYHYTQEGNGLPKTITTKGNYPSWDDAVGAAISEAFQDYTLDRDYAASITSISSNIPINVIIGVENNWQESGFYITTGVVTESMSCELVQTSHNIIYNFEIESIDTTETDGYEAIMFNVNNWDLRNKKLNKNFYRYYQNGQDIPSYSL